MSPTDRTCVRQKSKARYVAPLLSSMADEVWVTEAIRRAVQAGYLPYQWQRPVDWREVEWWATEVSRPGFRWLPVAEQVGSGYIIVAANGAIVSGQHRILGGLMGGNP